MQAKTQETIVNKLVEEHRRVLEAMPKETMVKSIVQSTRYDWELATPEELINYIRTQKAFFNQLEADLSNDSLIP